jgi:hypothetical protein
VGVKAIHSSRKAKVARVARATLVNEMVSFFGWPVLLAIKSDLYKNS